MQESVRVGQEPCNGLYDEALAESEQAHSLAEEKYKTERQGDLDRLRTMIEDARNDTSPDEDQSADKR